MTEELVAAPARKQKHATDQIVKSYENLPGVLKQLGIPSLRKGQDDAIASIFSRQDSIVILPTGHGKSMIYIIPTLCNDWKTVIFSPLVALIQDQVSSLLRMGLRAGQLSSAQTPRENNMTLSDWESGDLDFLLVAPERLQNERFLEAMQAVKPDFAVVDEVHCISSWSDNFRPDYVKIGDFTATFCPEVILCLTATAPQEVEEDVRRVLGIPEAKKIIYMPRRANLHMSSEDYPGDYALLNKINSVDGKVIVYCSTVKKTYELFDNLNQSIHGGALVYNGDMKSSDRSSNQELFIAGRARVCFATNAFGMGVDIPDIRCVIYRDIPGSIEELSQGFGRAGRDGKDSECILYYDENSINTQEFFIRCGYPNKPDTVAFYNTIKQNLDSEGLCSLSLYELCDLSGVSKFMQQSIMANLLSAKVVERATREKLLQIKWVRPHLDAKYQEYNEVIEKFGIPNDNGFLEVDEEFMAQQIGVSPATIKRHLKILDDNDYIVYVPPPRGRPIAIIGDVDQVDFERLKQKEKDAHGKLQDVINFHYTADKHKYLETYFENKM